MVKPCFHSIARAVRRFALQQSGAVTVDWVALTAALCGMILAVFTIVTDAVVEDTASVVADRVLAASEIDSF